MTCSEALPYREVWLVDFEFQPRPGEPPAPICMVAKEVRSGRKLMLFQPALGELKAAPMDCGPASLFVAYNASAELSCHLALGWELPTNVLDLYVEFRNLTNGERTPDGAGLLAALQYFGLSHRGGLEKPEMQALAIRGGPFSGAEAQALLDYCETDVDAIVELLPKVLDRGGADRDAGELGRALLRGQYMKAVAVIEQTGVPIDVERLDLMIRHWAGITSQLIREIGARYGVFEGSTFSVRQFDRFITDRGIPWPRTKTGAPATDDDTFKSMSRAYPELKPLRALHALSRIKLEALGVGADGRSRTRLVPFQATTGRNAPSSTEFIFGLPAWLRGLIRPQPGKALVYVDWNQQEFGIAAALSGDEAMKEAYRSGDPYLAFAKQVDAVPPEATKKSHAAERERFKQCVLAVQYGMGPSGLAIRLGQSESQARQLLDLHRKAFPRFWSWAEAAVDCAQLRGLLWTCFGWRVRMGPEPKPRSLSNFPVQANGAEMLRLACILATEVGIRVCAPVHDALLIEGPAEEIDAVVSRTLAIMESASTEVLAGFPLRAEAKVIKYPDRYASEGGEELWSTVERYLSAVEPDAAWVQQRCCTGAHPYSLLSPSL